MQTVVDTPVSLGSSALEDARSDPDWNVLRQAIIDRALNLKGGIRFDFRLMLTDPLLAKIAGRLMWKAIRPLEPQVLVGPGFGATPLLFAISFAALEDECHVNVLMVRDQRKDHNQRKWVEGAKQPNNCRGVFVDDFMESGSAFPLVEEALAADEHPLNLVGAALLFDMWQPLGSRQLSTYRFPVYSLFKRHDLGLSRDCFDAKPPSMKGSYPDFIPDQPLWWRYVLNEKTGYPFKSSPVIADDGVFVADDRSRVWRHSAADGSIDWMYQSLSEPSKGIVQLLTYADQSLVFGCYDGTVTRLASDSGRVLWRWRIDSSIHATPELDVKRNRLFINTEQFNAGNPFGHLMALDWTTGKVQWKYRHDWWPPGSPVFDQDSNLVLATCNDSTLCAVNADTGLLAWKASTKGLVRGKPAVTEQSVLIVTEKAWLQCFNVANGTLLWERHCGQGDMHQFLVVKANVVYVLDGRWHLFAFNVLTGDVVWMSRLRSAGNWCPVIFGKYLVVLSRDGHLAVFDSEKGIKVWEGHTNIACRQPPAVGIAMGAPALAVAGNDQGLKVFQIHPSYAFQ